MKVQSELNSSNYEIQSEEEKYSSKMLKNNQSLVTSHIDDIACTEDGTLFAIGWIYDPDNIVKGLAHFSSDDIDYINTNTENINKNTNDLKYLLVNRPDVSEAMGVTENNNQHGFILVTNNYKLGDEILVKVNDDSYCKLDINVDLDDDKVTEFLIKCKSKELYDAIYISLGDIHPLTSIVGNLMLQDTEKLGQSSHCDKILLLENRWLIINGWVGTQYKEISSMKVIESGHVTNFKNMLHRYPRPDLKELFPKASSEALGYITAVKSHVKNINSIEIEVVFNDGHREIKLQEIEHVDWGGLNDYLNSHPRLYPLVLDSLNKASSLSKSDYFFKSLLDNYKLQTFNLFVKNYPVMVDDPQRIIAAVDKVYALGEDGILVYGWKLTPKHIPEDITVHNEYGDSISIADKFIPQLREDVASGYREYYSNTPYRCGFIVHIPMATDVGDVRAICFQYAELGDMWLYLPTKEQKSASVDLIKEMLEMVPYPNKINHYIFDMFDNGLGLALESINQKRLSNSSTSNLKTKKYQFGVPPLNPTVSIIVPLYGRYDFMQYQLSKFADDDEIRNTDLIYIVDDPTIVDDVLQLAARYQWLFDIPFRVVSYDKNLGFAGANNIGASLARADYLLLLNSDVFPQNNMWLSTLKSTLDYLPDAGAVGPLLQFGDGSIQHAGMHPRIEPQLPGFLLNTHPKMGQHWDSKIQGEEPQEHPMLTAACLLLKTEDYNNCGGFDEGYVIGDFEDSDLCLKLRTRGKKLYVVPSARLWHLERQSQTLSNVEGARQLITLFNGWRYLKKIEKGVLVNPLDILSNVGQQS